jgi:arylsulfatase A-like enzyme
MKRKKFITAAVAISVAAASAVSAGMVYRHFKKTDKKDKAYSGKMNFVFILGDDFGYMDTALNGSTFYETPNLQNLARDGITFTNAYAHPLCSPTRSALLTGQYPHRTMINAPRGHLEGSDEKFNVDGGASPWQEYRTKNSLNALPENLFTIGQAFQDNGYFTGFIGKHHLGRGEEHQMRNRGFDVDLGMPVAGPGRYYPPYFGGFPGNVWDNGELFMEDEHITDRLAREADKFITDAVKKGEPFLLELWDFSVHGPFHAKKEYIEYFKNKDAPGSKQENCYQMAAMIKALDDAIGKVVDSLKRNGVYDNTVIVFMGDNGGNMYDSVDGSFPTNNYPLRQGKGTIYEGGIRVPCVMKVPGMTKGGVIKENIHAVDFYPTLLELADITIDPSKFKNANHHCLEDRTQVLDGVSLVPLLNGTKKTLERKGIFTVFLQNVPAPGNTSAIAVNSGEWKLIVNYETLQGRKERYELYNLKENISETVNLADKYPDKVEELKGYIEEHLAKTPQAMPVKNNAYNSNAEVPIEYIAWDGWVKKFAKEVEKDSAIKEYPKVVIENADTEYLGKIKDAVVFRIGTRSVINKGYDGKLVLVPKKDGKKIYLPADILGVKGKDGYVESGKLKKKVAVYGDLIIVAGDKVNLTNEDIKRTHAYFDSFEKRDEVKWLPNMTPSFVDMEKNKMVYEQLVTAPKGLGEAIVSWQFDDGLDGFFVPVARKGNLERENGCIKFTVNETDAYIHSPEININSVEASVLKIRFKNMSSAWEMEVYWITSSDGQYNIQKKSERIYIPSYMDDFVTYFIDLGKYEGWKDNIVQIRIDGIDNADSGSILYDSIELVGKSPEVTWSFEKDAEGWRAANNMTFEVKDGKLECNITGQDAYMMKTDLSVPLEKYNAVKIRYMNTTNSTRCQVYFTTTVHPNIAGQFKMFTLKSNMTDFEEIVLDMSNVEKWIGNLTRLRFDPADSASSGVFYFDEIELVNIP